MRTVYVSHNSVGTALARSQVLPYLRGLADRGVDTELVTFERGGDFPSGEFPRSRWHAIRARIGSSLLVKAFDVLSGVLLTTTLVFRSRASLIHARSYVPAAIALVAGIFTRRPYVFDMRGFLGEEFVDAGYWTPGDVRFRAWRVAEKLLLRRAAHIVVLTDAAAARLRSDPLYAPWAKGKPVTVIPCAVDLVRFAPSTERANAPTLVYSGSVAIAYDLEAIVRLYLYAREREPRLRMLFLNRDAHDTIRAAVHAVGADDADVVVRSATFDDVPALLAACHVGIVLARESLSKAGSSPVKVAEYLACGLPVIVSQRLGDTDELVRRYDAGVVVDPASDGSLREGAMALIDLLHDPLRRANARRLAEAEFALAVGVDRYREVYRQVAGEDARPSGRA
jgi:glycosyltransferase involved in cell wall biosynthesis